MISISEFSHTTSCVTSSTEQENDSYSNEVRGDDEECRRSCSAATALRPTRKSTKKFAEYESFAQDKKTDLVILIKPEFVFPDSVAEKEFLNPRFLMSVALDIECTA